MPRRSVGGTAPPCSCRRRPCSCTPPASASSPTPAKDIESRPNHVDSWSPAREELMGIHTYIRTYIHTYIRTDIHTYTFTFVHAHMQTYIHAGMPTRIHYELEFLCKTGVRIFSDIHAYLRTCMHAFLHIHGPHISTQPCITNIPTSMTNPCMQLQ